MADNWIIAYVDKTVVKIQGLHIQGLDIPVLEKRLMDLFGSIVRIIGVTGTSIDMDVYDGIASEQILRNPAGFIQAVSAIDGVHAGDVAELASAKRIVSVDIDDERLRKPYSCAKERWMRRD